MPAKFKNKNKVTSNTSTDVEVEDIPSVRINKVAGTNGRPERITAFNWLTSQNEFVRIQFFEKLAKIIGVAGVKFEDLSPADRYAYALSAAVETRRDEEVLSRKRRLTEEEAEKLSEQRLKGFKKPRKKKEDPKYKRIKIDFYELIKKQREVYNFSWSDVCAYLQQMHGYIATRAYIQRSFAKATLEIEAENLRKEQKGV